MRKFILVVLAFSFLSGGTARAARDLVVADFDSGQPPNNIGGDYGTWNHDPNDDTQGCYYFAEPDDYKNSAKGYWPAFNKVPGRRNSGKLRKLGSLSSSIGGLQD